MRRSGAQSQLLPGVNGPNSELKSGGVREPFSNRNAVFFLAACELVIDCIVQTDIVACLKEGKRINPHAIPRVGAISQVPMMYSEFNKDTPSSYAMSSPGTSRTSRDVRLEASVLQEGRENANIDAGLGFIWRISA